MHLVPSIFVAGCLLIGSAAGESVGLANVEAQGFLGVAGQAYQHSQDFGHSSGAYLCKSTGAGVTAVTWPFSVPDDQYLNWVVVSGKRTINATPIELQVKKSCMHWTEVVPTTTTLATAVPNSDSEGFFVNSVIVNDQPNNYECRYWLEARFNTGNVKCTVGEAYIQKVHPISIYPDRIFRGSFHTNYPLNKP